jgi:hypothetical protein
LYLAKRKSYALHYLET